MPDGPNSWRADVKWLYSSTGAPVPVVTSVGTWLSLVEHSLGVRGVGSSNLPVPTNCFPPRHQLRQNDKFVLPTASSPIYRRSGAKAQEGSVRGELRSSARHSQICPSRPIIFRR